MDVDADGTLPNVADDCYWGWFSRWETRPVLDFEDLLREKQLFRRLWISTIDRHGGVAAYSKEWAALGFADNGLPYYVDEVEMDFTQPDNMEYDFPNTGDLIIGYPPIFPDTETMVIDGFVGTWEYFDDGNEYPDVVSEGFVSEIPSVIDALTQEDPYEDDADFGDYEAEEEPDTSEQVEGVLWAIAGLFGLVFLAVLVLSGVKALG
jgi:hypothetical protein